MPRFAFCRANNHLCSRRVFIHYRTTLVSLPSRLAALVVTCVGLAGSNPISWISDWSRRQASSKSLASLAGGSLRNKRCETGTGLSFRALQASLSRSPATHERRAPLKCTQTDLIKSRVHKSSLGLSWIRAAQSASHYFEDQLASGQIIGHTKTKMATNQRSTVTILIALVC